GRDRRPRVGPWPGRAAGRPGTGGHVPPVAGRRRPFHSGRWAGSAPAHPGRGTRVSAPPPVLAPDLTAGLRRLKLAAMRRLAPDLLVTAKTQRWTPEELLRTL